MDVATVASISSAIMIAIIGYLFTYFNNLRLARRKDRLERIDKQLRDFYGPLFAIDQVTARLYQAYVAQKKRQRKNIDKQNPHKEWRLWIREVFMPLNIELVHIVTEHADLLEESYMPPIFLDLCAHVYNYKPIMKKWESGDYTQLLSTITFPKSIRNYAIESYNRLKEEQAKLLGIKIKNDTEKKDYVTEIEEDEGLVPEDL